MGLAIEFVCDNLLLAHKGIVSLCQWKILSKGRDIFSSGYPPGAFLRGAKIFSKKIRGPKKLSKNLRGLKIFANSRFKGCENSYRTANGV